MAKATKREPLVVGQRVWLEELSWYSSRDDVRAVSEFEIVRANSSTAYAVRTERADDYKNGERVSLVSINQRTREAKNSVSRYNVWLSAEAFKANVQYNDELKELRAKAIHLVKQMNVKELRKVLEI